MAAMALARSSGPRKKAQGSDCQHQNSLLPDMLPSAALPNLGIEEGWQPPPGTPGCLLAQGRSLRAKEGLALGSHGGWAGASGTGPRLVVFWPLLVGPPSACSSDLLVSFWETEAEAKEGFCHPLHVPLTHLSHIFYIKR